MTKLLLDENLPKRLKRQFSPSVKILTVNDMRWNSMKNGDLLKAMEDNNFDGLITSDQNLIYQQDINKYKLTIYILKTVDNRFETVSPLVPKIISEIKSQSDKKIRIIE
jgi:hypothetical protein